MIKKLKSLISWVDFIKQFKDSIAQKSILPQNIL